jgi:hypothetical protein
MLISVLKCVKVCVNCNKRNNHLFYVKKTDKNVVKAVYFYDMFRHILFTISS